MGHWEYCNIRRDSSYMRDYYLGQKNRIIVNRVHLFRSDSTSTMIYEVLIFSMSSPALMTASMRRGIDSNSFVR